MGVGLLETREPKFVMAGVWQRGQWDVIGDGRDEWELEVEIKEDAVVYSSEMLELKLGGLCSEPLEKSNLVIVKVRLLEDLKIPLALLCMSWQVVDVASNGGLP